MKRHRSPLWDRDLLQQRVGAAGDDDSHKSIDTEFTTPLFTLTSVNAHSGPNADNIVSLKGINYNAEGGGNWMGIDYVQLHAPSEGEPPSLPARPSAMAS
jgi:hypothetical protein